MSARFVLAQISDLHVKAARDDDDPFDASANVRRALEKIAPYRCDLILATGDLTDDARPGQYDALAKLLADPPAPLFLAPGNHDDRALLRGAFPAHAYLPRSGSLSYVIEGFARRIVVLDTTRAGETGGVFDADDARWLDATLAASAAPSVVAMHHPPFLSHERLFDRIALAQRVEFAAVIARHPQVELVLAGHHHRPVFSRVAHAPAVVAPATSYTYSLALRDDQKIGVKSPEAAFALHVWDGPESAPVSHFVAL